MRKSFGILARAWHDTLATPDIHAERIVALMTFMRVWLLLPWSQTIFSPAVNAFTRLIPQFAWGLGAALIAAMIWYATLTPYYHRARIVAMYWAGGYWLLLAVLFVLGEPRALSGWFCLAFCLVPLMVISRLTPSKSHTQSDVTQSDIVDAVGGDTR